jgi:hypothetical protein
VSTRTAKKTPAKKTTPATPQRTRAAKKTTPPAPDRGTTVDLRHPLPIRPSGIVGPLSATEQYAVRAALASAALQLPIPVRAWNGSQAHLTDGTLLIHNPAPDRHFTAHIACPYGAIHGWPINSASDLREARTLTRTCTAVHAQPTRDDGGREYDWNKAIHHGTAPVPAPKAPAVFQLREGIRRAEASALETQPLSRDQITAGLHDRAHNEQPKEHPQP